MKKPGFFAEVGFLACASGSVTGGNGVVILVNNNNGVNELGKVYG